MPMCGVNGMEHNKSYKKELGMARNLNKPYRPKRPWAPHSIDVQIYSMPTKLEDMDKGSVDHAANTAKNVNMRFDGVMGTKLAYGATRGLNFLEKTGTTRPNRGIKRKRRGKDYSYPVGEIDKKQQERYVRERNILLTRALWGKAKPEELKRLDALQVFITDKWPKKAKELVERDKHCVKCEVTKQVLHALRSKRWIPVSDISLPCGNTPRHIIDELIIKGKVKVTHMGGGMMLRLGRI